MNIEEAKVELDSKDEEITTMLIQISDLNKKIEDQNSALKSLFELDQKASTEELSSSRKRYKCDICEKSGPSTSKETYNSKVKDLNQNQNVQKSVSVKKETIEKSNSTSPSPPKKSKFFIDLDDLSDISSEEFELDQKTSEELSSIKGFKCEIAKMSENGEGTWNCSLCTFTNVAKDYKCAMCHNNTSNRTSNRKSKEEI